MPFIETNGIRVHYLDEGEGPALVWVPGENEHAAMALRAHAPLLDRYRIVAVDPRGQGGTAAFIPAASYAPSLLPADLRGVLDALGLERPAVGGHGRGGRAALEFARTDPDRVAGVIAVAPPPDARDPGSALYGQAARRLREEGVEPFIRRLPGAPRSPERRAEWEAAIRAAGGESIAAHYEALAALRPLTEESAALTMPVLVVCGAHDPLLPDARVLIDALPDARLALIPGAGRMPAAENPADYFAALNAFLTALGDDFHRQGAGAPNP